MATYMRFTSVVSTRRAKHRRQLNKVEQHSMALLTDSLINAEAVRHCANEDFELGRFAEDQRRLEDEHVKVSLSLAYLNFGQQIIFSSGLVAAMGVTAAAIVQGAAPVGHMVLVSSLLFQLAIPLNFLGMAYRETQLNLVDLKALNAMMRVRPTCRSEPGAPPYSFKGGELKFENVRFHYPDTNSNDEVLRGLDLTVKAGERVAIVGTSGSGKSTVAKLLCRLYDPTLGRVLVDDQDLRHVDLASYRDRVGVVPQDVVLFNESVMFNLRYGKPDASREEVRRAATAAQLDDVIAALPRGFDTVVGERGLKLSGGEKQRVGIARCILRNPSILIFDEATSSLDVDTEGRIVEALDTASRDITAIVIAHRMSATVRCDRVVVIHNGVKAEEGTHAELLATPGSLYAAVWRKESQSHLGHRSPISDLATASVRFR
eukprot:GHVU01096246.1.p1 GENE.GHVU01096246.1~~GHVU01096246.1.p1  ORF type:complete len:478 (+),score=102.74 GHVU01096246.1:141-1436(+)